MKRAEQRERLRELENLIANLGTGEETITDQAFEERLKQAERDVMELLREAQNSKGELSRSDVSLREMSLVFVFP